MRAAADLCPVSRVIKKHCDCGACRNRRYKSVVGDCARDLGASNNNAEASPLKPGSSLPLVQAPHDGPRVCVFDFDNTLTCEAIGPMHGYEALTSRGFGGHARVRALDTLFTELRQADIPIVIVSFNLRDTIVKALRAVGLEAHIAHVFGSDECAAVCTSASRRGVVALVRSCRTKPAVLSRYGVTPFWVTRRSPWPLPTARTHNALHRRTKPAAPSLYLAFVRACKRAHLVLLLAPRISRAQWPHW